MNKSFFLIFAFFIGLKFSIFRSNSKIEESKDLNKDPQRVRIVISTKKIPLSEIIGDQLAQLVNEMLNEAVETGESFFFNVQNHYFDSPCCSCFKDSKCYI
jgi:hypothetical protein